LLSSIDHYLPVDQDRKGDGVIAIRTFRRLRSDKRGATAIEYGLIAALVIIAMLFGLRNLGGGSGGMWAVMANRVVQAGA
jgi:pilus assembly protein Flp/PilA